MLPRILCGLVFLSPSVLTCAVHAQFNRAPTRNDDTSVVMLAPRQLERMLNEGAKAISEQRYSDGITALGTLLNEDTWTTPSDLKGQDFFLPKKGSSLYRRTLKSEAEMLLASLPEDGREILELKFGVGARQRLEEAVEAGDVDQIAEVGRKFAHTEAGYDARLLLAHEKLARGFPIAAASMFQSLMSFPHARKMYGTELVKAAVISWLHAERVGNARLVLRYAATVYPNESFEIDGLQIALETNSDWDQVIAPFVDRGMSNPKSREEDDWLVAGGNPSRAASTNSSLPLKNARWVTETHSSVPEMRSIKTMEKSVFENGRIVLPKFEIRAVGDLVLAKTTDAEILAIDKESGLTKWPFYHNSAPAELQDLAYASDVASGGNGLSAQLQSRVWASSAFGRFNCDRDRLYYISQDDSSPSLGASRSYYGAIHNVLQGVSIAGQGRIEWQVGGGGEKVTSEPTLDNAYFLGPPISYEGDLYVLAEQRGETRLVVLDPATGKLRWSQQLIHPTRVQLKNDSLRQTQALTPTISNGVALCPTGVGAIVAVDILNRSLKWCKNYEYYRAASNSPFSLRSTNNFAPLADRWHDDGMIVDDGILVVSPVESDYYFACNILTGATILPPHQRYQARYVAGVRDRKIILVGEMSISCVDMRDGATHWEQEFPDRLRLVGKGTWLGESCMVPLTRNTVVQFNCDDGSIVGRTVVDQELGNLFSHDGDLISFSPTSVSVFHTQYQLTKDVERRLAKDPRDIEALNDKAELRYTSGDIEGAYEILEQALSLDAENVNSRFLMVETLLAGLAEDFNSFASRARGLEGIVEGPQRFRYLQWLAIGSIRSQDQMAAFESFLNLMDERTTPFRPVQSDALINVEERRRVDTDNWIATELGRCFERAGEDAKKKMDLEIKRRIDESSKLVLPLRREIMKFYRWHPSADDELIRTAIMLREREEQTSAEKVLVPLLQSEAERIRAVAGKLLAQPTFQDSVFFPPNGKLLSMLYQNADAAGASTTDNAAFTSPEFMRPTVWNTGAFRSSMAQGRMGFRNSGRRLDTSSERFGRPEIVMHLVGNMLKVINMNGEPIVNFDFRRASADSLEEFSRVTIIGGIALLETSSEVVAFDIYQGMGENRDALIWRHSLVQPTPGPASKYVGNPRIMANENDRLGVTIFTRDSCVGPVTPAGIVIKTGNAVSLLDIYTGRKLWERVGYDQQTRMAGEGMQVAIVNPSMAETEIVDCRDGSLIEIKPYEGAWQYWFTAGGKIVDFKDVPDPKAKIRSPDTAIARLRVWSPFSGTETILPDGVKAHATDGRYLAALDRSSQLHYFDLLTDTYVKHQVPTYADVRRIQVRRFQNRLAVMCDALSVGEELERGSINGHVYGIDCQSGDLIWERPAQLFNMEFPEGQPRNSPFMATYRIFAQQSNRGRNPQQMLQDDRATVVVTDLRTGKLVVAESNFVIGRAGQNSQFSMYLAPRSQMLELSLGNAKLTLNATNEPKPPQPVAHFGLRTKDSVNVKSD